MKAYYKSLTNSDLSAADTKLLEEFNEVENPVDGLDKPLKQLLASFGVTVSNDEIEEKKYLTEVDELMAKYGLQYILAATKIFKSSLNLLGQKPANSSGNAAVDNDKATVDFFKSSFDVLNNIDPTGICGVISAFISDRCISLEDVYTPEDL